MSQREFLYLVNKAQEDINASDYRISYILLGLLEELEKVCYTEKLLVALNMHSPWKNFQEAQIRDTSHYVGYSNDADSKLRNRSIIRWSIVYLIGTLHLIFQMDDVIEKKESKKKVTGVMIHSDMGLEHIIIKELNLYTPFVFIQRQYPDIAAEKYHIHKEYDLRAFVFYH